MTFVVGAESWRVGDINSAQTEPSFHGITDDVALKSGLNDGDLYFYAPSRFLGDQQFR